MGQGIDPTIDDGTADRFGDQLDALRVQQAQLARRRELAKQMIASGMEGNTGAGYQGGRIYMVGSPLGNIANAVGGAFMDNKANSEATDLAARQAQAQNDWSAQRPDGTDPRATQEWLAKGQNMGLRTQLEAKFAEQEAARVERGEQAAADRVARSQEAEAARIDRGEQAAADRVAREDLRRIPAQSVHVSVGGGGKGGIKAPSGYRYNEDGTALEPIPGGPHDPAAKGGKPLTPKQLETQRGFMDLDSSIANYEKLLDAYDFQGKTAVDPAKRAALEGAYTDLQMKLKTLYELGAPQAGDLKLLSQALPSPVDMSGTVRGAAFGADPFKAKLGETKKLLNSSRANFETQMKKETPDAAKPPAAPSAGRVRVNSKAEFDALPAGSKWETPDGKRGTK